VKIAVLIPIHGGARAGFTESLANLVSYSVREMGADVQTSTLSLSNLSVARNQLLNRALQAGADYALKLDCDHVFPPNALQRLLAHGKEVVGINQMRRMPPHEPTAIADGRLIQTTPENPPLQEVESIGLGMCLMRMDVLAKLQRHADANNYPLWPLYREDWPEPDICVGEDRYFCARLKRANIPIHVDQRLSLDVGHIADTVLKFPQPGSA
jgi:glycosyltransferase involved in cell wall biosynthesis